MKVEIDIIASIKDTNDKVCRDIQNCIIICMYLSLT